jgi:hypothetical protein
MKLFGRTWDRKGLLQHVGDVGQIGGATPIVYDEGPERGVRAIEVRTGTGFAFTILPDRGMDVFRAELGGASLAWHSPTGPTAPAFFEHGGLGWLRGFYGGMLVTCGLTHAGPPHKEGDKEFGLHGRVSYLPARDVSISQGWNKDEFRIKVRGKVRETSVFGDDLLLTRRIWTMIGENRFWIEDDVENLGYSPAPHPLLYHVNGGFPVVSTTTELLTASTSVTRGGTTGEHGEYARFQSPTPGFAEEVYFHRLRAGKDGRTTVALVNRAFQEGRGIGYALRFPVAQMPCFTEWKMMGQGLYVVGTEPGNINPEPREKLRREGRLPMLQPGERKTYEIEFVALGSPDEIKSVEQEIKAL